MAIELKLIFARAANGTIGRDNTLPWHLPEDLAHFRQTTLGCPVIMGRRTWESLPPKFRPLPGRLNIVVTRQPDWRAEGAQTAHTVAQAVALCPPQGVAWVIGGAELFASALPLASSAVVTVIEQNFDGDVQAPVLGPEWMEKSHEKRLSTSGLSYHFVTYTRRQSGA